MSKFKINIILIHEKQSKEPNRLQIFTSVQSSLQASKVAQTSPTSSTELWIENPITGSIFSCVLALHICVHVKIQACSSDSQLLSGWSDFLYMKLQDTLLLALLLLTSLFWPQYDVIHVVHAVLLTHQLCPQPKIPQQFKPEVDEDVNDEHDVYDEVHHVERRAGVPTALHGCLFLRRRAEEGC